jgi:hypothetical protein
MLCLQKATEETTMKLRLAPAHLAERFHRPLRFGRRWRGHERILRLIQVILIASLGFMGAQMIAHGVSQGGRAIAGLVSPS